MARQIEKSGLPVAFVTALPEAARSLHVNRIVKGRAITHPTGNPASSAAGELLERVQLLRRALEALGSDVPENESRLF